MAALEYPFVLGTAGHIDHGKTTLVKALSGVDCDRLSEEKKRGMTIELGFAPLTLPSGKTISIVDVPGHEKFIRQMVAGAAGIDAVMLVVAADDGVMPQTREHLEILTLLGIKNGITVINKVDLVDEDTLEMAKDDVRSLLSGTFLENAPLIPVSAVTGAGLDELVNTISELVEHGAHRDRSGAFFLPVDRAFHISGFGYNRLQKFRNADNLYFTAHHLNKIHKWLDLCCTLAECRNIICHFQCIIKTDICRRRIICHTV